MRSGIPLTVTCFAVLIAVASCDIFSSTAHLQHLLHLERHIVGVLHNYLENTEKKITFVKKYLDNFYDSYSLILTGNASISGEEMTDNPLQAFHLVKRLSVDWEALRKSMHVNDWKPILKLTETYQKLMPSEDDLQGAAMALVRLQDTYRLNIKELTSGNIQGLNSGIGLTARDLLFLGKKSFNEGFYGHAIRWLDHAMVQAKLESNETAGVDEIQPFLSTAIQVHDDLFTTHGIDLTTFDTLGHPVSVANWKKPSSFESPSKRYQLGLNNTPHQDQDNFLALCRGETLRSAQEESRLSCRLESRDPFFVIQPVKTEQISLDPYIVQFHDLLTHNQVDTMKTLAEPKLSRSLVQGDEGTEVVSISRTSQNAWIGPMDDPLMAHVYRLVQSVTGLSTDVASDHAEMAQIANYGMGGHYTPHYDYLLVDKTPEEMEFVHPSDLGSGDRTATLMFYLSDVTRGGATVFPKIGAGVWPKKGAAAFWYNLKKNGKENPYTLHGACPVLHGSKWVANFWIREKGQAFRRRCDPNPSF